MKQLVSRKGVALFMRMGTLSGDYNIAPSFNLSISRVRVQ